MKEIIRANCGSTYETAESVLLLDVKEENPETIEEEIRKHYTTSWCRHSHDCCGCWRTSVVKVAIDPWTAVVHLRHSQNV